MATLTDGKFYSYFVSGVYDATGKKTDAFVVEDVLPAVDLAGHVLADRPVAPVNTQRARDLLSAAVAAVRG